MSRFFPDYHSTSLPTVHQVVDWLQTEARGTSLGDPYRTLTFQYLDTLVKKHNVFPSTFFINDVHIGDMMHDHEGATYAVIYQGRPKDDPEQVVCLKVLPVLVSKHKRKAMTNFCREALSWTHFNHPNILAVLGATTELCIPDLCLITPWMPNGNVNKFLKQHPEHDRLKVIREVAAGIEYLHTYTPVIVHGNIKGANVLVDENNVCRLTDIGLSNAINTYICDSTSKTAIASLCWTAPEIVQGEANAMDSPSSDIYSFACTVYEVMTGKPPFFSKSFAAVKNAILSNIRPERPLSLYSDDSPETDVWCPDEVWRLVEVCWDEDPLKRPGASELMKLYRAYAHTGPVTPTATYYESLSSFVQVQGSSWLGTLGRPAKKEV